MLPLLVRRVQVRAKHPDTHCLGQLLDGFKPCDVAARSKGACHLGN
jgi:hypothetical protein